MNLICVSNNDCSSLVRHWGTLLVNPGCKNGETRGFSAFSPSMHVKAKLAPYQGLAQINCMLDVHANHTGNIVFLGVFFFSFLLILLRLVAFPFLSFVIFLHY